MHITLQQTLTTQSHPARQSKPLLPSPSPLPIISTTTNPPPPTDPTKVCADEAELLCKYSQVAAYQRQQQFGCICLIMRRYYQAMVVKGGGAMAWGSYGLYAMRVKDRSKAEECLHEAIALDDTNPDCLAAYLSIEKNNRIYFFYFTDMGY